MRFFRIDKLICSWIKDHILLLVLIVGTILSVIVRLKVFGFESPDMKVFLIPWYNTIYQMGGISALREQVGNYGIPYQTLIALMTYLPIKEVYVYKITSVLFDYLIAVVSALLVRELGGNKSSMSAVYLGAVFCPTIFMNSAVWGQCDSIFSFFCLVAVLFLLKEKYVFAFLAYGIAFSFKLQAIFLFPFFGFYYIYKQKFTMLSFLLIPLSMMFMSLGGILQGRSVLSVFNIYAGQVGTYNRISNNYPTIWNYLVDNFTDAHYDYLAPYCIAVTVVLLSLEITVAIINELDDLKLVFLAFILTYTTVFFLPNMHERYSYIYVMLGGMIAVLDNKTIPAFIGLLIIDAQTYGMYLFDSTPLPWSLVVTLNLACFLYYCRRFYQHLYRQRVDLIRSISNGDDN